MKLSQAVTTLMLYLGTAGVEAKATNLNIRRTAQDDTVDSIYKLVDSLWETEGLEGLTEAVAIDSQSPNFNPDWAATGELRAMLDFYLNYATEKMQGKAEISHKFYGGASDSPPTPPLLAITVHGTKHGQEGSPEVLLYTHADTQPHDASDWTHGDPTVATRVATDGGDLVFGRGTTDDKYAFFASMIILETLMELGLDFPTLHIVIETEEESGSPNLEPHLDALLADIGSPDVVYVVDSGGPDNSHMWNSRTLRGLISGVLRVELLDSSVHSGTAGGIVPSVFRLMNNLIEDRIEDRNGTIIADPLVHHPSDADQVAALALAEVMGHSVYNNMPWLESTSPMVNASVTPSTEDIADMIIRNSFQSALAVIGWDHSVMPELDKGGNVVQPYIEAKLSLRCSPYTDVYSAADEVKKILEALPHDHGAKVSFTVTGTSPGFAADPLPAWYKEIVNEVAVPLYGAEMLDIGKGGTIGFLAKIQKKLQGSIIHNSGVNDPASNGHAPDESLDVGDVKKFTSVLAYTLHGLMSHDMTAEDSTTIAEEEVAVGKTPAAEDTPAEVVESSLPDEPEPAASSGVPSGESRMLGLAVMFGGLMFSQF